MNGFTFNTTPSVLHEAGGTERLASLCREHGARSALVITDPGIVGAGLLGAAERSFADSDVAVDWFTRVEADPPDTTVRAAAEQALAAGADIIIGFGGGSSMDVAKVVALLASGYCRQSLEELYGVGSAQGKRLPLIQIPTTAGTGSEVTPIAIITTGETTKSGIVSPLLLPDIALLDPALTLGLPPHVTAATGIDAMVHAIEAYTSKIRKNPVSDALAREALQLLSNNIVTAVHQGDNLEARSAMLLGALQAGQAFANAPVAAVHALAYPLGGHFHIPHGLSNSLVLPQVLRFNEPAAATLYEELAPLVGGPEPTGDLIHRMESLIGAVELPRRLRDMDIGEDVLPTLAADAMKQQRLLVNNPREVSEADALAIYREAY
ncbi:alcohol dehydrogenase [Tamilnaduibacter salinus]|uniref:Alcohol dehydrogenase n=1 Tax=Tamilnaduibacter salinus TaxID=1484056 RepID=A0A2A2I1V3_9GAMM|nr:iron-containing alcohol dehydrogenase [Tamilnaduibacter salinus]PAV25398.1 alcohol dehydrogenase [Tamilnaduibacter salinus]